jgi:hypothetical protein
MQLTIQWAAYDDELIILLLRIKRGCDLFTIYIFASCIV